jgi:hypothetical protein
MTVLLTPEHLAWILNISREWDRTMDITAAIVQERMDARFPRIEHAMIWERLLVAIGAR